MKFQTRVRCQTIVILCYAVLSSADQDYDNKLTKLWSLSSASNSDGSAVVNVTSASIVIPSSYSSDPVSARTSRVSKNFTPYAFRPRAIPLKRVEETPQEKNVYYTQDNKYKTEILFPGNYFAIPKEKSTEIKEPAYNPLRSGSFEPQAIPLIRSQGLEKRSLDVNIDPITEEPEALPEPQSASRRSLSYILGAEDEEDSEDDEDGEYETEDDSGKGGALSGHRIKHKLKKAKKYSKYMMPLLLAYKLKYFALVPVMIGGLILLVGATGMAGFFFALFAAVMGLQKGGY
ncbi:uncharacterized protein LOC120634414 [Pararge aegeria]|uniref:Jg22296 protein n=1 Tax=Pararge aegeria aegeria TaxID=348720 RepID=A0A8S4SIM3_9NEOP|nr:uncharacterized protein LOC120634414 [Pararge aegeria]CAH2268237.1 jg22296 [Pararge aegeria aegeria]